MSGPASSLILNKESLLNAYRIPWEKYFIHSIPTLQAAQQVYKALRAVHPEAGKDALLAMMRQRPVLLLDAVPQQDVAEVLKFFKSFGISATFVVEEPQHTAPPLERNRLRTPEGEPPSPGAAAKRKATKSRGWWGRQCLAFGVIICGALFAFWMFNPVLATSLLPFLPAYPQGPQAVFGFSRSGLPPGSRARSPFPFSGTP